MKRVAQGQGWFNIVGGLWPILHLSSFEAVFGPKQDKWLEYTVGGLMLGAGAAQVLSAGTPDGQRAARLVGLGVAGTFLAIDLIYVPAGRIRWTYLIDAAMEVGWLGAWAAASRDDAPGRLATAAVPA